MPSGNETIRPPAFAGRAYPERPEDLGRLLAELFAGAPRVPPGAPPPRGVIVPHADYALSGSVAAAAFSWLRRGDYRRAIVIGPSHHMRFDGLAAPARTAFATPLGTVPIDTEAIASLTAAGLAHRDDGPHGPEHSLELELPFLQHALGPLPIVPLLTGDDDTAPIAEALTRLWSEDSLLVVSTDLSHYEPAEAAHGHDARTAAAIERFATGEIGLLDACGHLALNAALEVAKSRGLRVERLSLRNSADAGGDPSSVVGYGAWALAAPR